MPRILLFEDDVDEGGALVDELLLAGRERGLGDDLEILWFHDGFRSVGWRARPPTGGRRPSPSRLGPEHDREVDGRLPIFVFEKDTPPRLFGPDGERQPPQPGDRIWWPVDFHAAVVDRFHLRANRDLGISFLDWLNDARFSGPVEVMTRYKTRPNNPRHLDVRNESKLVPKWRERVAHRLMERLASRMKRGWAYVGTRGMDPTDFDVLSRFYDTHGEEPAPVEWKTLWLGTDDTARKALLRFFPSLSEVEPDQKWTVQWRDPFPDRSGTKDEPVAFVHAWLQVLDRVSEHTDFPSLLWIDLGMGSELTTGFINGLVEALSPFARRQSFSFLTVLLADEWLISSDEERALLRHGVVVEDRRVLLGAPVLWLERTMDGLSEAWDRFIGAGRKPEGDDYVNFIRFYFRALLVAHTRGRLVGRRSPAEWFTSFPRTSRISTTLVKQIGGKVWNQMPVDLVCPRLARHFVGDGGR